MRNIIRYLLPIAFPIAFFCPIVVQNHFGSGVRRVNNGKGVEINDRNFPFGSKKYVHGEKEAKLYIFRGFFRKGFTVFYDNNLDGELDKVGTAEFDYSRGDPNTEELFRRSDEAWKRYRVELDVERIVAEELKKNLKPIDQFDF